jgi:hypothetical protein
MGKNRKTLEEMVQQHRAEFELEMKAETEVWEKIAGKLPGQKPKPNYQLYWKVAAVLLLFTTLTLLVERFSKNSELAYYERYAMQQEAVYLEMIEERKVQLSNYQSVQELLPGRFDTEMQRLDVLYEELKISLQNGMQTDQLVDAMIFNLQMRVQLLDQQLEILREVKQLKNKQNGTNI